MTQPQDPWKTQQFQPGQSNLYLPPKNPEIRPLPAGWQQPIIMDSDGTYRYQYQNEFAAAGQSPEPKPETKWYLYLISIAAALILAAGVFLPWMSISLLGTSISINGVGGISAPAGFVEGVQKLNSDFSSITPSASSTSTPASASTQTNQPFQPRDGWILLALAGVTFFLAIGGISQRSKVFSIGILICGLACAILAIIDLWNTSKLIDDTYKSINNSTAALFGGLQVGFGLYLAAASGIAIFFGALLTMALFNSKPRFD